MKRAITLGGGGPAAGLHLGVLDVLTPEIEFDVWALSCIGAWVGVIYNQCEGKNKAEQTYAFFRNNIFRNNASFSRFPLNTVFGTDWGDNWLAFLQFVFNAKNYDNLVLPNEIAESFRQTIALLCDPSRWNSGDVNQWILNHVMAPNPFIRLLTSMMYLSNVNGLSRICYPDSSFMKSIKFDRLKEIKPFLFHNAFSFETRDIELFSNKPVPEPRAPFKKSEKPDYKRIDAETLCACSALPFIETTVMIGDHEYCEGALVDTVNFWHLLDDHPDLDEIWVSRIVDAQQIRRPKDLHDALANLCQLFAATVGEDDVKLFEYHVKEDKKWTGTIIEVCVDSKIDFEWSHANLDFGRERGRLAAQAAYDKYMKVTGGKKNDTGAVRIIRCKEDIVPPGSTVIAAGQAQPLPL